MFIITSVATLLEIWRKDKKSFLGGEKRGRLIKQLMKEVN